MFVQACSEALKICERQFLLMKLHIHTKRNRLTDENLTPILRLTVTSITPHLESLETAI
jgi:hypothetical protein